MYKIWNSSIAVALTYKIFKDIFGVVSALT